VYVVYFEVTSFNKQPHIMMGHVTYTGLIFGCLFLETEVTSDLQTWLSLEVTTMFVSHMTGTEQALKLDQLTFSAIKPRQLFKSILIQRFSQVKEEGQPLIQWLFISFSPRLSFIHFPHKSWF